MTLQPTFEVGVICDRCSTTLAVQATTKDEAVKQLQALIDAKRWRVTSRWHEALPAVGLLAHTPDLCCSCLRAI